ncbi:hypothetical protein IWQ55_000137 [Labrenzia sp. EL_208]|nr:hypothetical protein [Labrenzia sp. EL_132]MBG6226945.1 hypothetical protein [Labrenzia sp. EL_208]
MDGKGGFFDNIFVEWQWRTLKLECAYLKTGESGSQANVRVSKWVDFKAELPALNLSRQTACRGQRAGNRHKPTRSEGAEKSLT